MTPYGDMWHRTWSTLVEVMDYTKLSPEPMLMRDYWHPSHVRSFFLETETSLKNTRDHFVHALSQWGTLQCNIVSHWLGTQNDPWIQYNNTILITKSNLYWWHLLWYQCKTLDCSKVQTYASFGVVVYNEINKIGSVRGTLRITETSTMCRNWLRCSKSIICDPS